MPSQNVDQIEILIGEIQTYPIIWDKVSLEYKESHKKDWSGQNFLRSLDLFVRVLVLSMLSK